VGDWGVRLFVDASRIDDARAIVAALSAEQGDQT